MADVREISWSTRPGIAPALMIALGGALALGVVTFAVSLRLDPLRGWQAYLINFLFWGGLAQGAVVFAAIYHVVNGTWGPAVRRLAEAMVAVLPVSLILFLPLYSGLERFLGPVREVNPARGVWFDPRFVFVRGGLGLSLMTVLSLLFVYYSLRPEVGWALERPQQPRPWFYAWMVKDWQGYEPERQRCQRGMDVLAAGVLMAYPMTYTFMAFDLIMSLDPFWFSSLFGGYFFISTLYLGLAALAGVAVLIRFRLGASVVTPSQLSDLSRLLLGFDLTYLAMAWSQYIVIWYGNLPEETHFVILRLWEEPWAVFTWGGLTLSVFIPFLVFLSRSAKRVPWIVLTVAISIAIGLWLERYALVVPSLWHRRSIPLGWIELGITAGFFGASGLSFLMFLKHFPIVPFAQNPSAVAVEKRDAGQTA